MGRTRSSSICSRAARTVSLQIHGGSQRGAHQIVINLQRCRADSESTDTWRLAAWGAPHRHQSAAGPRGQLVYRYMEARSVGRTRSSSICSRAVRTVSLQIHGCSQLGRHHIIINLQQGRADSSSTDTRMFAAWGAPDRHQSAAGPCRQLVYRYMDVRSVGRTRSSSICSKAARTVSLQSADTWWLAAWYAPDRYQSAAVPCGRPPFI